MANFAQNCLRKLQGLLKKLETKLVSTRAVLIFVFYSCVGVTLTDLLSAIIICLVAYSSLRVLVLPNWESELACTVGQSLQVYSEVNEPASSYSAILSILPLELSPREAKT